MIEFGLIVAAFIGGVVVGTLYSRRWKNLYAQVRAQLSDRELDVEAQRAELASRQQTISRLQAQNEELAPLADIGRRRQASLAKQNEARKAARAGKATAK